MPTGFEFTGIEAGLTLAMKFGFNLAVVYIVVHVLYRSSERSKEYQFSYLLIGTIIFLLCYLLENVELELGLALGLFALFGILRYRTSQIPIKEMTYLFVVIGLSVINALTSNIVSIVELTFTNAAVIGIIAVLERIYYSVPESSKKIIYENVDFIRPDSRQELLEDLRRRTGLPISHVHVDRVDYLRNLVSITVYYPASFNGQNGDV